MALTKHLKEAFKEIKEKFPEGQFAPSDLYGCSFNRPEWVCRKLASEGLLNDQSIIGSLSPLIIASKYEVINQ